MKIAISVLLLSLFISVAKAETQDICKSESFVYFDTRIQTGLFPNTNRCFIQIVTNRTSGLVYRSHLFTSNGEHMIFNSFGPGPAATHTGARVFVYLPRTNPIAYEMKDSIIELTLGNGSVIEFDAFSSQIVNSTGVDIQEVPTVNRNNAGGVNVYSSSNIWLDFGFTLGHSPLWDLNGEHTINLEDRSCAAINSELLFKRNGEIFWKYKTDTALINKLNALCSN